MGVKTMTCSTPIDFNYLLGKLAYLRSISQGSEGWDYLETQIAQLKQMAWIFVEKYNNQWFWCITE